MKKIAGIHLLIDGYVRDGKTLNPDIISGLFDDLVQRLGMQYLQRPTALRVPMDPDKLQTEEDEGGWSVICQITTSHISLHGWPLRRAFMMDIFSCCEFDPAEARRVVEQTLGVTAANVKLVKRHDPVHDLKAVRAA
jgi:S-adenosylmethionine decarboxylase